MPAAPVIEQPAVSTLWSASEGVDDGGWRTDEGGSELLGVWSDDDDGPDEPEGVPPSTDDPAPASEVLPVLASISVLASQGVTFMFTVPLAAASSPPPLST